MSNETLDSFAKVTRDRSAWWQNGQMGRVLREPLLHFLVLGGLLFVINAVVVPDVPKEKLIEFSPEVRRSVIDTFKSQEKHAPSPAEMQRLSQDWLMNEIVYREALAQGFDKGDDMIRDRINQKMRLLIFSNIVPRNPKQPDLQKWLDSHRDKYDVPERISFFDVPMGKSEADAKATLKMIDAGKEPESVRNLARSFTDRPTVTLSGAFSPAYVAAVRSQPLHKWQAQQSSDGWHIVRVEALLPKRAVTVAEVSNNLVDEWQQDDMRKSAANAVRLMSKNFVIRGAELP